MKFSRNAPIQRFRSPAIMIPLLVSLTVSLSVTLIPTLHASSDSHSSDDHSGGKSGKHGGHGGHSSGKDVTHGGREHDDHPAGRGGGRAVKNDVLRGRKPIWSSGGIPEVELGRLNVARAPSHVLDRAWFNAQEDFNPEMAQLYSMTIADATSILIADQSNVARFHSPLQNLALYHELMVYGRLEVMPISGTNNLELASIFLGSAADKNIPITQDTVLAVNRMLGIIELSEDDRASVASNAEEVRAALLAGHDESDSGHDH